MTRPLLKSALLVILMLGCYVLGVRTHVERPPSSGSTLERLTAMGRLDILRVELSEVRQTTIAGYSGSGSLLLIVHGQVIVGVDLTQAKLEPAANGGTLLTLPTPRVTVARVDAEKSKVYRIDRDGLWQISPSDALAAALINKALADAQQTVTTAGESPAILLAARHATEHLLMPWAAAHGWRIEIAWSE